MPVPALAVPAAIGAGVVGLGTLVILRIRKMNKDAAGAEPGKTVFVAPNFKSGPAPEAVPAGKSTAGIPVITAQQFAAIDAERQRTIREDALKGILTLTATNGALFTEKSDTAALEGTFKQGDDIQGMFLSVDVGLAKKHGTDLTSIAPSGNVIFEALERPGATHTPGISKDPRKPGVKFLIPNPAITGAGDIL